MNLELNLWNTFNMAN